MTEHNPPDGLVLRGSMDPHAIEDDMISGSLVRSDQVVNDRCRCCPSDFQTNEPIVVCSGFKKDGAGTAFLLGFNLGKYVFCGSAWEGGPAGKRRDSGVTRS